MRIVIVSGSAAPRTGGIPAHIRCLVRELRAAGHEVLILAGRIDDEPFARLNTTIGAQRFEPFEHDGVRTEPFPLGTADRARMLPFALTAMRGIDRLVGYHRARERTLPFVVGAMAPGFRRAFAGFRADVVHLMGGEPPGHAALAAARGLGIPFVTTPFAHPGFWGDDELNFRLYRQAGGIVALLEGEATWLASNGVPRERIRVIGAAAAEARRPAYDVRERFGITGPLVLCVAEKRPYKYRLLLEAMPHIGSPELRVAFVGPQTPQSDRDFAGADPRVLDVPKVDEEEKWGWFAAAQIYCLPSVSEIMPVSILEAWRRGIPVVVPRGRWTADFVEHGVDGLITDPSAKALAEALEGLAADPARARRMGEAGHRKLFEKYTAAVVSAAHERLYESLVGAKER